MTNLNVKGTIEIIDKVKIADLNAGTKTQVVELRKKLDNYSSRVQDIIKANFLAYNSNPCDQGVRESHQKLLSEINTQNAELEKLKNGILQLATEGNIKDEKQLKELLSSYDPTLLEED